MRIYKLQKGPFTSKFSVGYSGINRTKAELIFLIRKHILEKCLIKHQIYIQSKNTMSDIHWKYKLKIQNCSQVEKANISRKNFKFTAIRLVNTYIII